jgi:ferredoxin
MMGSGGAIVMDEDNCMVAIAKFYLEFICDESCGKCTPCRIGTTRALEILDKITKGTAELSDLDTLEKLCRKIIDTSLCGLGQTAPNPILSTLTNFREEYLAHIVEKRCPAGVCRDLIQIRINPDLCKRCGMCKGKCPVAAIHGKPGPQNPPFEIEQSRCIKCGTCIATCPFKAIGRS